ncbi:sensor histidine kinase [Flavobacterium cerinum]|uniref:histidine kinase n=1 Tax=Flavobacterium cerinum TaxID=2502784 RepID=A0ABY5IP48_9FLAO|nr:histidine kinase [Flavobacterium cerinum]UUC43957.1 histidine kinase [Flavobacterium cerinum]
MEKTEEIRIVFWLGTLGMLFLAFGLLSLVLYYQNHFYRMKRKETELLLKTSLETEKNERRRIAADLHDSVSGDLNAIRNYLTILQRSNTTIENREIFDEIRTGVEMAIENTRKVSYNLMPPLLEIYGLVTALDDYLEGLKKKTEINFQVTSTEEEFKLAPPVAYELFRIIQEFTTNMIKYGKVTEATVSLELIDTFFTIKLRDNGIPFNFTELLATSKGTGVKNINSRLKIIGADFLQQETETGNSFTITLKKEQCLE